MRAPMVLATLMLTGALVAACSPEARRMRDGGRAAEAGNYRRIQSPYVDPRAADTTLWPGRAPTPRARLEAGTMRPPPAPVGGPTPAAKSSPKPEQRVLEKSAADPPRPEKR